MLYTGAGDSGKTSIFGCDQRISKSSVVAEALGSLDEINSFLGITKIKSDREGFEISGSPVSSLMEQIQNSLFIVQAQLAGADKEITKDKISDLEGLIKGIEKELPPIKSFFISGGNELSASLDFARTLARRAERRVVAALEEGKVKVSQNSCAYMNRLSSLLYALARLSNHKSGIKEHPPTY